VNRQTEMANPTKYMDCLHVWRTQYAAARWLSEDPSVPDHIYSTRK
jgi:hypothetical protein